MYVDKNIQTKNEIIKEIKISKNYEPNLDKIKILLKRYEIWKDLYTTNKKIAPKFLT